MAPFAGDTVLAIDHSSAGDYPAATAGAQDGAKGSIGARCGTIGTFRGRQAVGVVGEPYGPTQSLF